MRNSVVYPFGQPELESTGLEHTHSDALLPQAPKTFDATAASSTQGT